jgi:cell division septation protein DedD
MADEGFHEIQLGKKQLFFVGMAAALYSVVVFSLGVWVGQDVRRPESEIAAEPTAETPADATPEPTKVAPNELDYAARLGDGKTPPAGGATTETKPDAKPVEPPSPPEAEVPTPVKGTAPTDAKSTAKPAAPAPVEKPAAQTPPPVTKSGGVMVQVGAFNDAATAKSLATRLKGKGYAAFVFDAPSGPLPHKVRVGPLADKAEADKVMARLRKEERFSPFITR